MEFRVVKLKVLCIVICASAILSSCQSNNKTNEQLPPVEDAKVFAHPLDPLSAEEIALTTTTLKQANKTTASSRFASI
jgi:Cu2+-containing amine oxidase